STSRRSARPSWTASSSSSARARRTRRRSRGAEAMSEQNTAPPPEAQRQAPAPAELEALKERLQTADRQRDEYLALAKQARADFETYQKRAARDLATERRFAQVPLAGDLLPALDNLDRALGAAAQAGDEGALSKGVAMVQAQLLDVLRRHGVTRVEAK